MMEHPHLSMFSPPVQASCLLGPSALWKDGVNFGNGERWSGKAKPSGLMGDRWVTGKAFHTVLWGGAGAEKWEKRGPLATWRHGEDTSHPSAETTGTFWAAGKVFSHFLTTDFTQDPISAP